ncbi:MAG: ATP-binding cassette domain-containing protein, partial [Alphaproteobacteria bacterium]|nr:ATP-binding cassette domain-containing protein [Alphaproteobacteria bacterium]
MAPAVSISDARLDYDGVVLFDGLSLTLAAGCITALLGPSGIGKTSLLRLIAGLAPAGESGRVTCDDGRGVEGRVAYMAQSDLLLP